MTDRELLLHGARTDFMTFARLAFNVLKPGTRFKDNWHLHAIAQTLREAQVSRQVHQIISMPPRSLKSFLGSEAFPAYLLGKDPTTKIIHVTYGEKLSRDSSENTERIMRSEFYRKAFPRAALASATKLKLTTTQGGMRLATSVGGPTTGFGGDWVIVDDAMNAADAHSEAARESVKNYFDRALSTRVNDETAARFIVIMQRLHADDLAGHLLAKGGWDELKLQAKATEPAWIDIGEREMYEVKVGDLLHEARLPQLVLDRKLRDMGSINFQAQFQQDPIPADGVIVKRDWLDYYTGQPALQGSYLTMSVDTATKTNPANDYSVCTVWAHHGGHHDLVDLWRDKVEYQGLKAKIIDLYNRYRADRLLIEDQGNGAALVQELRTLGISAVGRPTNSNKMSRLIAATSYMESRQMRLPSSAPWRADFESELLGFPNRKHDDQVDSVSQYFGWIRERGENTLIVHRLFDHPGIHPLTLRDVLDNLPRY